MLETINLMVTGRCNIKCPCCYQKPSSGEPSLEAIQNICKQGVGLGLKRMMLSGGEPLLRKDIASVASIIRQHGIQVVLSTNGTLVTADLARSLHDAGVDTVSLSIDLGTGLRVREQSDDCIENAASLLLKSGVRVVGNVIVTHENVSCLEKDIQKITGYGIRNINFLRPKPARTELWFEQSRLHSKDLYRLQRLKTRLAGNPSFDNVTMDCALCPLLYGAPPKFLIENKITGCGAGIDFLAIAETGDIFPCPDLKRPEHWLGNISNCSLADLWENSPLLNTLRDHQRLGGGCGKCKLVSVCRGCRSMALFVYKDLFGDDPDCPYRGRNLIQRAALLTPIYAGIIRSAFSKKEGSTPE